MRRALTISGAALRRRTANRHSSVGENRCISRPIPFSRWQNFTARSCRARGFAHQRILQRVDQEKITEIVFALPADVEGESTTNYIVELLKDKPISLTRIARGIPAGGGLESADELTLSAALSGRTKL